MKEGFQSVDIEPLVGYMDFFGPTNEPSDSSNNNQILKGNIHLKLNKAVKIKTMTVKFKGQSSVHHYLKLSDAQPQHAINAPLLPKLKTKVLGNKSTIFPAGDHSIPWELEIPNIYPRSFSASKRGTIQYEVELKISLGINKKAVTAHHPIVIRRHLITSQEAAALVKTNSYENTANKFHYEIEAPSIICIEKGYLPISIKYNKAVRYIYTQFIQTEIYRSRNISKAEADMAIMASKKNSTIVGGQTYESFKNGESGLSKFFKRIQPVTLNTIDPDVENEDIPLLLVHNLDSSLLTPGIESPLVAIYHQLEVTFNFGHATDQEQQEEIRAKIPVLVSSVPDSSSNAAKKPKQKFAMEKQLHKMPLSVEIIDTTLPLSKKTPIIIPPPPQPPVPKSTTDESTMSIIKNGILGLVTEDDSYKYIRKVPSDQNLESSEDNSTIKSTRSITPPLPPPLLPQMRPNKIDTQLANNLQSSLSLSSPLLFTPNRPTFIMDAAKEEVVVPTDSFMGLLPPPRRARKKEPVVLPRSPSPSMSISSRSSSTSRTAPPIPTTSISNSSSSSRPTSPMATPPLSPPSSSTRAMLRLNQSKSSSTTNAVHDYNTRKRANSIDEDYARSITSHYFCAELPPIPSPPAITRQKLPSIPVVADDEKEEHRRTRMYYEDESDEDEEYDDMFDYNFFLQQQQQRL